MATFNKTIIIGRLKDNPVSSLTDNGKKIAEFTIGNSNVKDGEIETQWHKVIAVGKQAGVVMEHLWKGDLVCIEGRIETQVYNKQDGKRYFEHMIIAEIITFLASRKRNVKETEKATA